MLEQKIKIGEGGRLIIPAPYRKALQVEIGDELVMRLQDGELRIFHQTQALKRLSEAAIHHQPKNNGNATDDFLTFRKKDE